MPAKSVNSVWVPPAGLNSGSFAQIGGVEPVGNRFQGMLGQKFYASNADALKLSQLSTGTLYMGCYQLVKLSGAVTRGQILQWDTLANNGQNLFQVTATVTAASAFRAGIAVCNGNSGEYSFIQTEGIAGVLYGNSAVGTIGLQVIQATALDTPLLTVATVNTVADATAWTAVFQKALIGIAYETPTQNAVRRVWLNQGAFYRNEPS